MKNIKFKKLTILEIVVLGLIVLGTVFGLIAAAKLPGGGKPGVYAIVLVAGLVSLISGIIALVGVAKGQLKTSMQGIATGSALQFVGPLASFIIGMIGMSEANKSSGITALSVSFVVALFASGLIVNSFRGFRKDKENHTYTTVTSFIAAGALFIFGIIAVVGMGSIPATAEAQTSLGFAIAFSICFVLADIISFVTLAICALVAAKEAPKTTVADADGQILTNIAQDIKSMKSGSSDSSIEELRKAKQMLDEGLITQEDYDKKKEEILKK